MYFPYLRGMKHELAAVKALIPTLSPDNRTIPIIEPVKVKLANLNSTLKSIEDANVDFKVAVIVNPMFGEKPAMIDLIDLINQYPNKVIPAFIAGNSRNRGIVADFVNNVVATDVIVIHENDTASATSDRADIVSYGKNILWDVCISRLSATYLAGLTTDKVFIEDAFTKQQRNADYPNDEFFSDLHSKPSPEGYVHFGDYTIMVKDYKVGGGPANAVALHALYLIGTSYRMKHFVSDSILEPDPVNVQYDDARTKLLHFFTGGPPAFNSAGAHLFSANPSYQGLGKPKEFSIMHHIELRNL